VKDDAAVQRQARTPRRWVPKPNGMENPIMRNLHFFTEKIRDFHDLLKQKPCPLFMLLGISVTSLMIWPMYLDLVERILVCWNWKRCLKLLLTCPDGQDECAAHAPQP
jgi:hypothetical protein